jgi:hypothetical protein
MVSVPLSEAALPLVPIATLDVSAASGLVRLGDRLIVVADDDLALAVYRASDGRPLERVPLWPGTLPAEHAARKKAKPDLEALAFVDALGLVALGSGSRPTRQRGACVPVVAGGALVPERITRFDLAPLHAGLADELGGADELNLEGAAASGSHLRLFQRGNGAAGVNAVIDLDLAGVRVAVDGGAAWTPALVRAIHRVALPPIDGVALGFTDASPLPDGRIVFAAAAEAGGDTYADGACAGSAVGILDGARVVALHRLDTHAKLEGVHASLAADGTIDLLLVADADDPAKLAGLYAARIPA